METQPVAVGRVNDQICSTKKLPARHGEQRTAVRYPLELPLVFRWTERGQVRESRGRTRDVSVRGAFVVSGDCPPCGTRVAIKMKFPATVAGRLGPINGDGVVLRIEIPSARRDSGFVVESNGPRLFSR